MPLVISFVVFAVVVLTLIDIIRRDDSEVKHLPKIFWILIVILVPLIGCILWWVVGREFPTHIALPARRPRQQPHNTQPRPPLIVDDRPSDVRSTEQQLADLDREIEEWRLKEEEFRKRQQPDGDA